MKKKFKGYEEPLSTEEYLTKLLSSKITSAINKRILDDLSKWKT